MANFTQNQNIEKELDWDATIENDGQEFVLLPEGDYNFEVLEFERGRHPGSIKLPPCNKATVHIRISAPEGQIVIRHNLFLHTKTEGLLCSFFNAIGQKQKGEKTTMNWTRVPGSKGRCKIETRSWVGTDGEEKHGNQIAKFYPGEQQPAAASNWAPGKF